MTAIMVTEPIAKEAMDRLIAKGYKIMTEYGENKGNPMPEEVEAVIVRMRPITREWMEQYPNLKVIAYHGVGIDGIDLDTAKEKGIRVTFTPGANALSVAEHTMALMMALSKKLLAVSKEYSEKGFDSKYDFTYTELSGKTLGLVGMGNIGRLVAKMAKNGFGMRVLVFDPFVKQADDDIELVSRREEIFLNADYVSLHLPLNDATCKSVGTAEFSMMKPTACLLNCARGAIVNEQELITALQNSEIGGAGLDVTDPERCEKDSPLFSLPNVIVTPHIAASTEEALIRVADACIESVEDVLAGRKPAHCIV